MSEELPANPPKPVVLQYQPAEREPAGRRPWWAYGIVGIYLVLWVAVLTFPIWFSAMTDRSAVAPASVTAAIMTACGLALIMIPVKAIRQRQISRRSIWIPIVVSGFLIGVLILGAVLAAAEYFRFIGPVNQDGNSAPTEDSYLWLIFIVAFFIWAGWSIVFGAIAMRRDPTSIGMKLHRALIAGSVLELLIAVPAHLVVRRRPECCAGTFTAIGICIGVCVAFVSFGPAVFFLYHRRFRQIARKPA